MREVGGPTADAYYYRATSWCMVYNRSGNMRGRWSAFRAWDGTWTGAAAELEALFVRAGACVGELEQLFDWDRTNGWILRKRKEDVVRQAKKRKAGLASARARRRKRRKGARTAGATKERLQRGRSVGTVDAMLSGASADAPRSTSKKVNAGGATVSDERAPSRSPAVGPPPAARPERPSPLPEGGT